MLNLFILTSFCPNDDLLVLIYRNIFQFRDDRALHITGSLTIAPQFIFNNDHAIINLNR